MLVLTRRTGESIVIGDSIVVTVLEVRGGQIRIGIDAPRDLAVHRSEVYEGVVAENRAAAASAGQTAASLRNPRPGIPRPGEPSAR